MLNTFGDLARYYALNYAGIIGLSSMGLVRLLGMRLLSHL